LPLATPADYNHLVKNALKIKKDPAVKIAIKQLKKENNGTNRNKENDVTSSNSDIAQPNGLKPKKSKVCVFFVKFVFLLLLNISRLLVRPIFCPGMYRKMRTSSAFDLVGHVIILAVPQRFAMSPLTAIIYH
jgi:hypothetical protein